MKKLLIAGIISLGLCSELNKYFINHLIEIDNKVTRPFNNQEISGKIYISFDDPNLDSKFAGEVDRSIKKGQWIGWWANGRKRYKGTYVNGQKIGFWHEWDNNGLLRFESLFLNGKVTQLKNCTSEVCDTSIVKDYVELKF